jgi:hypothetical protein
MLYKVLFLERCSPHQPLRRWRLSSFCAHGLLKLCCTFAPRMLCNKQIDLRYHILFRTCLFREPTFLSFFWRPPSVHKFIWEWQLKIWAGC